MKILFTLSLITKITSFQIFIFHSSIILQFLFHFRCQRRLFPFNGVLFTQEIRKALIMRYDLALRLEKTET